MIYDVLPVNNYIGNNLATTFEFDFYIDDETQLKVYLYDENQTQFLLEYGVDYSINEFKNENGSYITFPLDGSNYTVLADNQKISLELDLPVSQETQYNNSSLLNLESLEKSFDYLTRLIQILKRKLSLCVRVSECSDSTPQDLMDSISNAQKVAFDSSQQALEHSRIAKESALEAKNSLISANEANINAQNAFSAIEENNSQLLTNVQAELSSKISLDGSNAEFPYITESYQNGTSFYRVWSDGWIEQGGLQAFSQYTSYQISLLKSYSNSSYHVQTTLRAKDINTGKYYSGGYLSGYQTTTKFALGWFHGAANTVDRQIYWYTCGY